MSSFQGSAAFWTWIEASRFRFKARCNSYRTDDGDDDGKSPRQSFPPVCAVPRPARLMLYILFGKERHHHGNHPHHRRTALPVRGWRLLLEQQAQIVTEIAFLSSMGCSIVGLRKGTRAFARLCRKEHPMKQQEVQGKVKKAKGKVKETVGILTGDKKMEREGSLKRAEGTVQEGLGKAGRKVGEAMTHLGNAIKK